MANQAADPLVLLYNTFDTQLVNFASDPTFNKSGNKSVQVSYGDNNKKIVMQTPVMEAPFGVSKYTAKDGKVSWSVDLAFKDLDNQPKVSGYYNAMNELDSITINKAVENSERWFDREQPLSVVTAFYRHCVRPETKSKKNDNVYPPSIKLKVQTVEGKPDDPKIVVYDENRQKVDPEYVTPHSTVRAIVELKPMWFIGKSSFGLTWKLEQLEVVSRPQKLAGYSFQDDEA